MIDEREISRRGIMLVLSSPSGAGKTTLTRNLLDQENIDDPGKLELSISATTRARRPSEIDGVHYRFMSKRQFESMRDSGELLEWAEVHGKLLRHAARAGGNGACCRARRAVRH